MSPRPTFVIVGAGLAGATAAQTLRREGFDGRLVLVGEEHERPYLRPPLSKDYLRGEMELEGAYLRPEGWYPEHDVEVRLGRRATGVDLAGRAVSLDDGERLPWTRLLLTPGSSARRLEGPGSGKGLAGVHYLRTMGDAAALRADLAAGGRRVVVVGSGWIGLEVAAAARSYGNDVTVVGREGVPLERAIGAELGGFFAAVHRERGVRLVMSAPAAALEGAGGRVTAVVLGGARRLPADVVVVGIGAVPSAGLAAGAGLETGNGVTVDARLRTSHPDVFAAGDVANAFHPTLGRHLRVEHWANALKGGKAAARSMLGGTAPYDEVPYFYTDQFDVAMEYVGFPDLAARARVVYRGDVTAGAFVALWVAGSRLVAGMAVNVRDVVPGIEALVRSEADVQPDRLADVALPLDALAGARP